MKHVHMVRGEAGDVPATEGRLIRWARWYDPLVTVLTFGQSKSLRRLTADLAGIRPGDRVLDVGCGTGDLTLAAASRAGSQGEVAGIDASPEMIEVARRKAILRNATVRFEEGLIERIPFPDGYFDVALSSLMIHHLPADLKRDGLAEVYRVLKPGGRLLIVDIRGNPRGMFHTMIVRMGHSALLHQSDDVPALLKDAGFEFLNNGTLAAGVLGYTAGRKAEAGGT